MKRYRVFVLTALVFAFSTGAMAQGGSSSERRALREYTSPQELVSIAPTTPMDRALTIISEVSKKFTGKIVVDAERRTNPIKIDIQGMHWRDALEAICRKNDIWYSEYENYIQVTSAAGGGEKSSSQVTPGGVVTPGIAKELVSLKSREVKISAYFLEANLTRLEEQGINWNLLKSNSNLSLTTGFKGADNVSTSMFSVGVVPHVSFANIDALAKLFSNFSLGEVLSGPQVIVRSGEDGRIQVGQDFSIRERDFAGNLIDKFYSAGTIIKVTPQVITEQGVSFIHLMVEVERSDVTPGALSTIVNRTKANTNLLLLDNEESIIGGLYSTNVTSIRSGIPFLKDLPWYVLGLRYLFGYNKDEVDKKELIILLKAELVPTIQERIAQKKLEDGIFKRWTNEQQRVQDRIDPTMEDR
jgi:type IV pilus assembly protein PilQ